MGRDLNGKELGVGLSQRPNGVYQARYKDQWGRRQYLYGKDLKELRRRLAVAISDAERLHGSKENLTLDVWFERWFKTYKVNSVRPNTLRSYKSVYEKNVSPALGNRRLRSITKSDVQELINELYQMGYGFERQNEVRVILIDLFQRAVEDELLVRNPAKGVKTISKKESHAKSLTVKQQKDFMNAAKGTFYYELFTVALNTGLRPGELFALTRDDINFESNLIRVNKTLVYQKYLTDEHKTFHLEPPKTEKSKRSVPINSACREALMRQLEKKERVRHDSPKDENEFIFTTKYNTPLNSVLYAQAIASVAKRVDGLERFGGHVFRHTFATRCFEKGVSAKVVQAYLGHASIKMTLDSYTTVLQDVSEASIESIVEMV